MEIKFFHISGSKKGKTESFSKNKIIIGRGESKNLDLKFDLNKDKKVTRNYQAEINVENDGVYILDNNSKNGTYLNDIDLSNKRKKLKSGDLIQFGRPDGPIVKIEFDDAQKIDEDYIKDIVKDILQKNIVKIEKRNIESIRENIRKMVPEQPGLLKFNKILLGFLIFVFILSISSFMHTFFIKNDGDDGKKINSNLVEKMNLIKKDVSKIQNDYNKLKSRISNISQKIDNSEPGNYGTNSNNNEIQKINDELKRINDRISKIEKKIEDL